MAAVHGPTTKPKMCHQRQWRGVNEIDFHFQFHTIETERGGGCQTFRWKFFIAGTRKRAKKESRRKRRLSDSTVTETSSQPPVKFGGRFSKNARSEEHTSELQSPCNLVCR